MQQPQYDLSKVELKLFNTETREKVPFSPVSPPQVKMYTCGPTVYNFAHIGNFRTYVFEDILRRTLKFFGYEVTQVMNLTDVDDKTIRGAINQKVSLNTFTKTFKDAFFEDIKTLNIEMAEKYPAATDYIPQMIEMTEVLLSKGIAYRGGDNSIYFAIQKFPRYGCLSHLNLNDLIAGASDRLDVDEYDKDSAADFVLWKAYDPERDGDIFWESPFGPGRPGWHIECSAMAMEILGDTIDIHVGGVDNMFPHHENEIAQSEACSGHQFAKLWMHSEHLVVDSKKMSKSLGNFFTLRDLLVKGFTGTQIRCMLLQTHYKTQLNFTFQGLDAVAHTLQRLHDFIQRILEIEKRGEARPSQAAVTPLAEKCYFQFAEALGDDLNISVAFAALFEFVRHMNVLCDAQQVNAEEAALAIDLLKKLNTVLGVLSFDSALDSIPSDLADALEKRIEARKAKDWKLSDELRDYIHSKGYIIEDTPQGARLKKGEL